jgi:predicted ferric reductase
MSNLEIVNFLQRATGIIAIGLITLQIYLGATRKAIKFHMLNGIIAYSFVFLHPLLMVAYNYLIYRRIDPFFVYIDVCLLCPNKLDFVINLGRIGFWFITIAVIAAKFRKAADWLNQNWRKLHILNYFAFYFISAHAINISSDSTKTWFITYFIFLQLVVVYSVIVRVKRSNLIEDVRKMLGQLDEA